MFYTAVLGDRSNLINESKLYLRIVCITLQDVDGIILGILEILSVYMLRDQFPPDYIQQAREVLFCCFHLGIIRLY